MPFQIWTLKVLRLELGKNKNEPMAILEMKEDTDTPIIAGQKIEFTDFPLGEIKLYFQNGVLFLPSFVGNILSPFASSRSLFGLKFV